MDAAIHSRPVTLGAVHPLPFAGTLDLSEHMVLILHERGIAIGDRRPPHECTEAPHWVWPGMGDESPLAVYLLIEAQSELPGGVWETPVSVTPEPVHEAYGNRVMQAKAAFAGGAAEDWTLRAEPQQVGFDWIRQPHALGGRCAFRVSTPIAGTLQFWRTAEGTQCPPMRRGNIPQEARRDAAEDWSGEASAVLLYSDAPRTSVYLDTAARGMLRIALESSKRDPGDIWHLEWIVPHGQMVRLSGNMGLPAATRHYCERLLPGTTDASIDFGAYYNQTLLGGLALLADDNGELRSATLPAHGVQDEIPVDEIAFACECLGVCTPAFTIGLLDRTLTRCIAERGTAAPGEGLMLPVESSAGLLLMMVGLHTRLTGSMTLATEHQELMRTWAESLLALRRTGEALPMFSLPGCDGQRGKHPAGTAIAYIGLSRWAALEERMGNEENGRRFAEAAFAMQWAAIAPVEAGGLWHLGRGTFVRCLPVLDNRESSLRDPQTAPGSELDFGQQIIAFWLGLCPDDELVRRSYDWIDYAYTYASGRGGPAFPPGYQRSFHALIDVAVRLRYGCGDVVPLLQRSVDNGARSGLPFARNVLGAETPCGTLLDNAPYFEIVLQCHYGLDYDAGGWRLTNPRPIPNYPLTRLTNLRHKNASYAVTWQGRGTIQRVTLNGAPHPSRTLDRVTGDHEVVVTLG